MSDEFLDLDDENLEDDFDSEDEYETDEIDEEISTSEVDRVLETLSGLMENVESETVHEYLDEAYNHIFSLVYEDEDDDEAGPHSEAA